MSTPIDWHHRSQQLRIEGRAYIDGAYVDAIDSDTFDCVNPATGGKIAEIASCKEADVDRAVASARNAFERGAWSRMPPLERKRIMLQFSALLLANREELALLESLNVGKQIGRAHV